MVTGGGAGELKIFKGRDYGFIKSVKLLLDADSIGYDPATAYLYVTNGDEGAELNYSVLSVIDTTTASISPSDDKVSKPWRLKVLARKSIST